MPETVSGNDDADDVDNMDTMPSEDNNNEEASTSSFYECMSSFESDAEAGM